MRVQYGLAAVALCALTACEKRRSEAQPAPPAPPAPAPAEDDYENIYARDYVGPEACGECHEKRHAQWSKSLHRVMNQKAGEAAVLGDFSGVRVDYAGGHADFDAQGGERFMTLTPTGGAPARRFRVTRTIGSRYLQEYVGVAVDGGPATEIRLPFGWWVRERAWFHQQYFDSWYDAEYDTAGAPTTDAYRPDPTPWASRCAWCHNTYPFELRLLRDAALGRGTDQFVKLARLRRDPAIVADNLLPVDELVTVGISCESCHLGGREHAVRERDISFAPRSPDLHARPGAPDLAGGRKNATLINAICAQCHSTPSARWPNGGVTRNSSEALDLAAGACPTIKCADYHDPHVAGPGTGAPDQERPLAACVRCHSQYATPDAARAHSRHRDVSCLDCHMPRMVQGVSRYARSHRISSPTNAEMLAAGAPNACNLCHLDQPLSWTLAALHLPAGDGQPSAVPVGAVWLHGNDANTRLAAAAAYGRSPLGRAALPALLQLLDQPVAYDRMWMKFAVEDVLARPLTRAEYDPTAAPATRATQAQRLRARYRDATIIK